MSPDRELWGRTTSPLARRLGQILGLLFLIGPISDLAGADLAPVSLAAIALALAAFVALWLALLPPVPAIARLGPRAVVAGLGLLAILAGATLALGAPQSFAALFVYFVAAVGLLLPVRPALVVVGTTAAAVGIGLWQSGASGSVVAAHTLTILSIGVLLASLGGHARTIRELRAAREELAELAVTEERLRIARDLHDLLGQSLSVVALKSDLADRLVDTDPAAAHAELADVRRVSRQALTEMRAAVHGYRRLAFSEALDSAGAALTAAGIDLRVDGTAEHLPEEVESVLAWALREATTNVVRHSGARACEVTVETGDDRVALQVDDDGAAVPAVSAGGTGLAGLAERARRLDGTLEAGARPGGGYRLRLQVPLTA
jgi:two-component system, NarL family, sensor histidine kinase DesK